MKRALRILAVVSGLALALVGTMAVAAWLSSGTATATATATTVLKANAPTATPGSGQVSLAWGASTLANQAHVGGYQVFRHDGNTSTPVCATVWPATSCSDPTPLATNVSYGVVATVGAHWTGPESDLTPFRYDQAAPVTTASVAPAPAGSWITSTPVTVTLQATDPGNPSSGVDHITYQVDGGSSVTVNGATASVSITASGTHTVTYGAVDKVGNAESTHSTTVKIDPNAPTTTVSASATPNGAGWYHADVTLTFSSSDGTSGIASITANGTTTPISAAPSSASTTRTISTEGTNSVGYFATDVAGNVENTNVATVKIDKTAPTATVNPTGTATGGYYTSNEVTISSADATSGVASTEYSLDRGTSYQSYTGPITLPQGTSTVRARVTDTAGNTATTADTTINVDSAAPTATLSQTDNGQPTVSGADVTSGVASVSWRDGGTGAYTQVSGSSTTLHLANGSHTIWYFATDNAGLSSVPTSRTITVNVDTTAPSVAIIDINNDDVFLTGSSGTGSWAKVCSNSGMVCATITDDVTPTANLVATFTLVRSDTNECWDGTAFVSGSACSVKMNYNQSKSRFEGGAIARATLGAGHSFTLTVRGTDSAGNVGSQVRTFTTKN